MSILTNGLKALFFAIYGLWVWTVFIVCCVAVILLLIILPGMYARRVVVRAGAKVALALSGLRPRVAGLKELPAEPCVVVANHASYFDGIVMTALLPPRFQYVVKQEMQELSEQTLVSCDSSCDGLLFFFFSLKKK